MHTGSRLITALRECPRVPVRDVWYRSVDGEIFVRFYDKKNPMRPLWGLGAPAGGARFTPKSGASSLYLAEDLETANREGLQVTLGTRLKPPAGVTRATYSATVSLSDVIDLRDAKVQRMLGTTKSELKSAWRRRVDGSFPPTQRLGRIAARNIGVEGLIFKSTKGTGACMVVFIDNLHSGSSIVVRGPSGVLQQLP